MENKATIILLYLTLPLFICCSKKHSIVGNWRTCTNNATYVEIHCNDTIIEWCPDIAPLGMLYWYDAVDDNSINVYTQESQLLLDKKRVVVKNNTLTIYSKTDTVVYYKIIEPINWGILMIDETDESIVNTYIDSFNVRKEEFNCRGTIQKQIGEIELLVPNN